MKQTKACQLDLLSTLLISHFVFSKLVVKRLYNVELTWLFFSCKNPKDWLNVELAGIFPVVKIVAKPSDKSYLEK